MFEAWGRIIFRRRRLVLAVAVIAVVLAAIWGTGVSGRLQSAGGFVPPGSQSQQEANLAAKSFGPARGDMVLPSAASASSVRSRRCGC
jgi:trehalose monomycolate/heme transporter